jgi:hypothetical protein
MAVWMQIIGFRKSDSIKKEKTRVFEILKEAEFEFDFVKDKFGCELKQTEWNLTQSKGIEYFELSILDQSLKVYFNNPYFIEFSGSFELFSSWHWFADERNSHLTNGIRNVFRKIAAEYGIEELFYFSEWFFSLDDIRSKEESFEGLINRIQENPKDRKEEFYEIESNKYYIEKISPVANNV